MTQGRIIQVPGGDGQTPLEKEEPKFVDGKRLVMQIFELEGEQGFQVEITEPALKGPMAQQKFFSAMRDEAMMQVVASVSAQTVNKIMLQMQEKSQISKIAQELQKGN